MKKRIWGIAVMAVATAIAFSTVRALTFTPQDVAGPLPVKLPVVPAFDINTSATNLSAAIRFQTVSNQDAAQNQIAEWDKLHAWLRTTYPLLHTKMSREVTAGHSLLYKWEGSDASLAPIILMAHQDVVPVTPGTEKDWSHPPFSGTVEDGKVWGRGAIDDKGSLIALFEAIEALRRAGFSPKRSIYLFSGHDEEVGGTGANATAALLKARGVKAEFTLDEGSAIIEDEPLTGGAVALIGIAEKGFATLRVTAPHVGGHSSMPPKKTGVVTLASAITAISGKPFPLAIQGPVDKMLSSLAAKKGGVTKFAMANQWLFGPYLKGKIAATPAGAAMLHTTIAPTMLQGSPKENVLPQSANVLINYRMSPGHSSAQVLEHAKKAANNPELKYEWVKPPREASPVSSTNSNAWRQIVTAAQADDPGLAFAPYLVVGGTDSRNFVPISKDVYRFIGARVKQSEVKVIHGTNEHISIDNLKRSISFYAQLIQLSAG